jgi:DNA-binding transcriptional ArsR family regulator
LRYRRRERDGAPNRGERATCFVECAVTTICPVAPSVLIYNHMVVDTKHGQETDRIFHALADATRRDIYLRSLEGEHSVSTLASFYPMSFAAVQKHVAVLERARLVNKRRHGREQLVRGDVAALRHAFDLLGHFETVWRERLDRFDAVLSEEKEKGAV